MLDCFNIKSGINVDVGHHYHIIYHICGTYYRTSFSSVELFVRIILTQVPSAVTPIGSINMSEIMTGKCSAKIAASDPALNVTPRRHNRKKQSSVWSTVPEALEDVTALFYDEDRNEIYTGNSHGLVHVWSN
jgi:hypothetical protein